MPTLPEYPSRAHYLSQYESWLNYPYVVVDCPHTYNGWVAGCYVCDPGLIP